MATSEEVPLPPSWPEQVKRGMLEVIGLAHLAVTTSRSWCENSRLVRVRLASQVERLEAEVGLLREEMRIKDARVAKLAPSSRATSIGTARSGLTGASGARRRWRSAPARGRRIGGRGSSRERDTQRTVRAQRPRRKCEANAGTAPPAGTPTRGLKSPELRGAQRTRTKEIGRDEAVDEG